MTFSTEIAAARPEDTREVLERLWYAVRGPEVDTVEYRTDWRYFFAMLDCGAFLSAAEMLLDPEWTWNLGGCPTSGFANAGLFGAMIQVGIDQIHGEAATPALALAAAIAKSLEGREDR